MIQYLTKNNVKFINKKLWYLFIAPHLIQKVSSDKIKMNQRKDKEKKCFK